ncbi:MAG: hypothetical protein ABL958_16370 [Bdellovibrionia bacterium]
MKVFFSAIALTLAVASSAFAQNDPATIDRLEGLMHQSVISGLSNTKWFDPKKPVEVFQVYNTLPNTSWAKGYNTLYIGSRKSPVTSEGFLKQLGTHVESVRSLFYRKGLQGYVIMATPDYEIAFQNWSSKEAMEAAFASAEGQLIQRDAATFLENIRFKQGIPNPFKVGMDCRRNGGGGSDGTGGGCK